VTPTATVPVRAVTHGPRFHFFGYYDKTPWDVSGRYLLALETDVMDRRPGPSDEAVVGLVDLRSGCRFEALATTRRLELAAGLYASMAARFARRDRLQ
jgi:hypothetical protein